MMLANRPPEVGEGRFGSRYTSRRGGRGDDDSLDPFNDRAQKNLRRLVRNSFDPVDLASRPSLGTSRGRAFVRRAVVTTLTREQDQWPISASKSCWRPAFTSVTRRDAGTPRCAASSSERGTD